MRRSTGRGGRVRRRGVPRVSAPLVFLLLLALATACSSPADDDPEVLGIQVERDGTDVATFEPTEDPAPEPTTGSPAPVEEPSVTTTSPTTGPDPDLSPDPTATSAPATTPPASRPRPTPSATQRPTPTPSATPTPSPTATPSPTPSPTPTPVGLTSRDGHSYIVWFREEEPDGQGGSRYVWGEASAAPPVTREGSEPLRVTLVDLGAADHDDRDPRDARCLGWLEADGDRDIRARGTVVVDLLVDDVVAATTRTDIDVTVAAGARVDLATAGDVEVRLPDVERVTCAIRFVTG